ncbi:MAG: lyase family protein [Patescibacteria group bacterium]|nr:lyase family protein [Patescibacteria group bacterium]
MKNLIMPGNPRYQPRVMAGIFGYDNLYKEAAGVEIATLMVLGEIGVIPSEEMAELQTDLIEKILAIPTTEVDRIEREITHHDVRAWVRAAQEIIRGGLKKWVHIPLTSYDPLDTGRMLQFQKAYDSVLRPSIKEVVFHFADLAEKFASQIQIGRTHGQHALPITVGFWLATILSRIVHNWEKIDYFSLALEGKISGAVGAHNAQIGLGFNRLCGEKTFEKLVLEKLNLPPARISNQILPPEPLAYFLFSCCMLSASLAQFGRDCRHLMRTEIAEVAEAFEATQVGSSTMAHKRNPINFENLEGMWIRTKNEFGKVLDTLISEHQRDLVGSSVVRDFPIIVINLQQQLNALLRPNNNGEPFISRITINGDACQKNFQMSADLILAEPLYIAIQMAGYQGDAHELVNRKLVSPAAERKVPLVEVLSELAEDDDGLKNVIGNIPEEVWDLLHYPERYTGDAAEKTGEIVQYARSKIKTL